MKYNEVISASAENPLAFYGLVILVLESIIAIAAANSLTDQVLLFWLFVILLLSALLVVGVVL